jgi:hypothetical protein
MTTSPTLPPPPEWVLTLHALEPAPADPAAAHRHTCPAEPDEEKLAVLLAGIVRGLLQRSPLEATLEQCEPSSLCFL